MDKARAPAKERQKWDKLVAAMFDYESRHKDILLESVSQLGTRLAQLPVTRDCPTLEHQGWQAGQAVLEATRARFDSPGQPDRSGSQAGGRLARAG
jgi:predicted secreted Zn-dependent protease